MAVNPTMSEKKMVTWGCMRARLLPNCKVDIALNDERDEVRLVLLSFSSACFSIKSFAMTASKVKGERVNESKRDRMSM